MYYEVLLLYVMSYYIYFIAFWVQEINKIHLLPCIYKVKAYFILLVIVDAYHLMPGQAAQMEKCEDPLKNYASIYLFKLLFTYSDQ